MKKIILSLLFCLTSQIIFGQDLYSKSFGELGKPAIIFLHGGPGYNCANFEASTAQALADQGFFVVVYDRRGEGRSTNVDATFTFNAAFDDLDLIFQKYHLKKASLIGHSFGGMLAILFANHAPEKMESLVLVAAPISLQQSFKHIIAASKSLYQANHDSVNLNYISMLESMDATKLEYVSYCLGHAMQNKFYSPKEPSAEAKKLYATFKSDSLMMKYASKMTYQAPQGFWKNEHYTTMDMSDDITKILEKKMNVFGMYGKDDGLYAEAQVMQLQSTLGKQHFLYLDHCSHNVFIDQQTQFITSLKNWLK